MADIQLVVFDLYGTLIYLSKETKSYTGLFADLGLHRSEELKKARRIALTEDFEDLEGFIRKIKPGAFIDSKYYQQQVEEERDSALLYPETIRILNNLKEKKMKLGLISNLASPYKKPFFSLGISKYFDEVLFSCEVGLRKPDPRIYQRIIEKFRINPAQTLMTGDKVHADVEGPKFVGMKAIHLDRTGIALDSISSLEEVFQYL
jgi:HAD superfamily hydrolase (TIGR01662 family)